LLLLVYTVTFEVREGEVAVVTTFGGTGPDSVVNGDGRSAGWKMKWPWPIQDVHAYPSSIQVVTSELTQCSTKDDRTPLVSAFLTWRISNPLAFFKSHRSVVEAESRARSYLRADLAKVLGGYEFSELINTDPRKMRLAEVEAELRRVLGRGPLESEYGIRVESAGIQRLGLPADVTEQVFKHMKETQLRKAQNTRSEGESRAEAIKGRALGVRKTILSYAERRAQNIRLEGEMAAALEYQTFAQDEKFAVFLKELETLKQVLQSRATVLLDMQTVPFDLFAQPDLVPPPRPPKP
jgi:membrane protease subunit HflC